MTAPWSRVRELIAVAGWTTATLTCAIVLLSVALSPESNWTVRAGLVGFCVLAIAKPADALLIVIAFLGFGIILSHLAGVPTLRVTEVLVVGSLLGCCVRAVPRGTPFRRALTDSISAPIALFAVAAAASMIVWLRVYQVQTMSATAYLEALVHAVRIDYFVRPGEFEVLASAAVILEGLGLYVAAAALSRVEITFFERALRMLALGGAALAFMSVVRVWEIVRRNPNVLSELRATYDGLRISPQIPDYIAAGSYFSLCWLAALGLAIALPRHRVVWVVASASLISGLYLTGSRSVIGAAAGGLVVLMCICFVRQKAVPFRGAIAIAIIAAVVMLGGFRWMVGRDLAGETARASLWARTELIRAGLHVIATRPLFGVGIDRFYLVAEEFSSPALRAAWAGRKNPHNDLLRFGGELGLVGLGLFLWIVIQAAMRMWQALRSTADARLAGLASGLVAFALTSMFSNPLMLREVSYAFWIALGLGTGYATRLRSEDDRRGDAISGSPERRSGFRSSIAWLLGGVLLISIPFRATQEVTSADPTRVSYGLSDWTRDPDGTRYRWSGPQATVFVSQRARRVEIPLSGTHPSGAPQHVEVKLNGRLINDVVVGADWRRLGIVLQLEDSTKPRRIDLTISPTWVRTDVRAVADEPTVVGIKVGDLSVIR